VSAAQRQSQIVIKTAAAQPSAAEIALSESLDLKLLSAEALDTDGAEFVLAFDERGLGLHLNVPQAPGGIYVDFTATTLRRRARDSLRKQNLSKAVGIKPDYLPSVVDATAGLGSDAFLLAVQGCEVKMLERSMVVCALLEDGLHRAREIPELNATIKRLTLTPGEFTGLGMAAGEYDVVYLDPMFPAKRKQRKSRKSMALLQELLPATDDEEAMFATACSVARKRVVVKRPKLAPPLAGQSPGLEFKGSSSRFDVYLQQ